jgi:hypothetical protein
LRNFHEDTVFSVHARPGGTSMLGHGLGKVPLGRRLASLLDHIEVMAFDLQAVARQSIWHNSRLRYRYRHRATGLVIEGSMRHKCAFVGSTIAHFELFHDADRMRAFFAMAASAS